MGKKSFLHYSFGQNLNKNLLGLGVHTSARTITCMVEHDYSYGRAFGRHAMPRNGRPKTSIMN